MWCLRVAARLPKFVTNTEILTLCSFFLLEVLCFQLASIENAM